MKRRNPKYSLLGCERLEILVNIHGAAVIDVGEGLKKAEAPRAYQAYKRFMKSLDGAIRHAQRQASEERRQVEVLNGR